jgi:polar amino acid transport system substrate-binding protein
VKRFLALVIVGLLLNGLLTACASQAPKTKIQIATDATYPPFESVDDNAHQIVGFDIELIKTIAAKANLEVVFVPLSYAKILDAVSKCTYDGAISAIPISYEGQPQVIFSSPYYALGQVLVVKKGNTEISDRSLLTGKTVGAQKNTASQTEIEKINGAKFKSYFSFKLAFTDLILGSIDAVISDYPEAITYVRKDANNLKMVGDPFAPQDLGIALCNQKTDLLKVFNEQITALKADGTIDKLAQKWIVTGVSQP